MANITKLTEQYIAEHPSVKDCLKKGLINYSSLTRKLCKDLNLDLKKNFDAILIACRRYHRKISKETVIEYKNQNLNNSITLAISFSAITNKVSVHVDIVSMILIPFSANKVAK